MIRYSVNKYNFNIKGVIHIGAHYGQENNIYEDLGVENRMFFEPLKSNFKVLKENVSDKYTLINKALGNEEKSISMFVERENEGQSSSILKPKRVVTQYPWIKFEEEEIVEMTTLDRVNFNRGKFNFINIDTQGYELEVFRGAKETLKSIDYIISEINRDELYEGCAQVNELEDFLYTYNFKLVETNWGEGSWGDGIFVKIK